MLIILSRDIIYIICGFFPVSPPPRKIIVRAIRVSIRVNPNTNPNSSHNPNSPNNPNNVSWGRTNRKEPICVT